MHRFDRCLALLRALARPLEILTQARPACRCKEHTRYLVDFELDALAAQVSWQAQALGIAPADEVAPIVQTKIRPFLAALSILRSTSPQAFFPARSPFTHGQRVPWVIGAGLHPA